MIQTGAQSRDEHDEMNFRWTVKEEQANERIDKYVTQLLGGDISRSQVQLWVHKQAILRNGHPVKSSDKVMVADTITVHVPLVEDVDIIAEPIPLDIYFEDEAMMVINKPRGMVVHPAFGHTSGTIVNALLYHCQDLSGINGEYRPGIVHRIDKDTSGLLMIAKHDRAHVHLAKQLQEHSVIRKYMAIVHGRLAHEQGTITAPIGRDVHHRKRYTVTNHHSKHAVTHFKVLERFQIATLIKVQLETGRTHQIRVHMKYIGHPLIGDPLYTRKTTAVSLKGQALHAMTLGFIHPITGKKLEFTAPLPADMNEELSFLRNGSQK